MNPTDTLTALESRVNELLAECKAADPNRNGLFSEAYGIGYSVAMNQVLDAIQELTTQNTPTV